MSSKADSTPNPARRKPEGGQKDAGSVPEGSRKDGRGGRRRQPDVTITLSARDVSVLQAALVSAAVALGQKEADPRFFGFRRAYSLAERLDEIGDKLAGKKGGNWGASKSYLEAAQQQRQAAPAAKAAPTPAASPIAEWTRRLLVAAQRRKDGASERALHRLAWFADVTTGEGEMARAGKFLDDTAAEGYAGWQDTYHEILTGLGEAAHEGDKEALAARKWQGEPCDGPRALKMYTNYHAKFYAYSTRPLGGYPTPEEFADLMEMMEPCEVPAVFDELAPLVEEWFTAPVAPLEEPNKLAGLMVAMLGISLRTVRAAQAKGGSAAKELAYYAEFWDQARNMGGDVSEYPTPEELIEAGDS